MVRTKTAPIGFGDKPVYVTCTTDGTKDIYGKNVWRDADGNTYELNLAYIGNRHRAHGTYWAFSRTVLTPDLIKGAN